MSHFTRDSIETKVFNSWDQVPEELKNDKDFVCLVIEYGLITWDQVPKELKNDKDIVTDAMWHNVITSVLQIPDELEYDEGIFYNAISFM
jgi:hypothetical protein